MKHITLHTMLSRLPLLLLAATPVMAALPEIDTVFYGRVLHLGGGEEYVLTSGELKWVVQPPAGSTAAPVELTATLSAMKGGTMSYQIRVPHYMQVSGTSLAVLPGLPVLGEASGQPFKNAKITVNGQSVRMADPAGITFDASALTRGTFRRLDLIVDGTLPDADGDGLPDWWEAKYHLDPNAADAGADPDGDGVANLAEYRAGTDPSGSDQSPKLPAEILVSLATGGRVVPMLKPVDSDSTPVRLTYTAGTLPAGVKLELLSLTGAPRGATTFTQADVEAGRLVISHTGEGTGELLFPVTLRDETPAHAAASSTLRLSVADAATLWAGWNLPEAARPAVLPVLHDATRLSGGGLLRTPSGPVTLEDAKLAELYTGHDEPRLFLGSQGADVLLGSGESDLIVARARDTVRGFAGNDRILLAGATGTVTVTDFTAGDVLDFRGLLVPAPGRQLQAYLKLTGTTLTVDVDGDGSGFTDLTVQLPGSHLPAELADLWDSGGPETGTIVPPTTLFLTSTGQPAEENLTPATITLRRRGDASAALDVPVTWSGTATMGRDYSTLAQVAHFAAGGKTASFIVQPLADDEREPAESIQITLGASAAGAVSGANTITLSLADLPSRVWLEVAERTAYKDSLSPAQILIRRSGPMAALLAVQLTVSGRATPGLDYRRLPATLTFAPAQDVMTLDVLPLATASISRGAEEVVVDVKADAAYQFGRSPRARVMIVDHPQTLAAWRTARGSTGDEEAFLTADADGDGQNGLAEFAFDSNPSAADGGQPRVLIFRDAAGRIGVEFRRWPGAPELSWAVEQSTNLGSWTAVPSEACDETECEVLASGQERVKIFLRDVPTAPSGMLRVRVDRRH